MNQRPHLKGIDKEFLKALGIHLSKFGYSPRISDQSFSKPEKEGKSIIHVSFIPHHDDVDLTIDFAVRVDPVETLVSLFDSKLSPSEKRKISTFGSELGNFERNEYIRWKILDYADIEEICEEVVEHLKGSVFPFVELNRDTEAVFRIFESDQSARKLSGKGRGPRYMRLLASAFLLNRPIADLHALGKQLQNALEANPDLYIGDFIRLRKHIEESCSGGPGDREAK